MIQAEAGLMAVNGDQDMPPLKFGVAVVDMMTGMYAAQAVLAALFRRERTGRGRRIEMALYDCGLTINGYCGLDALQLGHEPKRYGNNHPSIVPYGLFEAADGPLIIAVGNNSQFEKFCRQVIARPDIVEDPRYATNVERSRNRASLLPILSEAVASFERDVLLQRLAACGIPSGALLDCMKPWSVNVPSKPAWCRQWRMPKQARPRCLRLPTAWTASACPCAAHRPCWERARVKCCSNCWP